MEFFGPRAKVLAFPSPATLSSQHHHNTLSLCTIYFLFVSLFRDLSGKITSLIFSLKQQLHSSISKVSKQFNLILPIFFQQQYLTGMHIISYTWLKLALIVWLDIPSVCLPGYVSLVCSYFPSHLFLLLYKPCFS